VVIACASLLVHAQDSKPKQSEARSQIDQLSRDLSELKRSNRELQRTVALQKEQIDALTKQLSNSQSEISKMSDSLRTTASDVSSVSQQTQGQIQDINHTISNRTLYWIIGILIVVLLSLVSFFTLRTRQTTSARNLDSQIAKTRQALEGLESEAMKLDAKLIEILQSQLSIAEVERRAPDAVASEPDHRLPLKVGDEIHRMRKRIAYMPQDVKGLSALSNSLKRLEEEFNDNGYELEDLLGKKYVDGMKIEARFVDNPDIPKGEEIITEVLRPPIKYKGEVIQFAKVEVGRSQ
jgi:chromosome segregation ATPase